MAPNVKKICEFIPGPVHIHNHYGECSGPIKFSTKIVKIKIGELERFVEYKDWVLIENSNEELQVKLVTFVDGKLIRLYESEKQYIKENL